MEFRDILAERRMHRSFSLEPVDRERIERIAATIRHAPSGGFTPGTDSRTWYIPELLPRSRSGSRTYQVGAFAPGNAEMLPMIDPPALRRRPLEEVVRWERW